MLTWYARRRALRDAARREAQRLFRAEREGALDTCTLHMANAMTENDLQTNFYWTLVRRELRKIV